MYEEVSKVLPIKRQTILKKMRIVLQEEGEKVVPTSHSILVFNGSSRATFGEFFFFFVVLWSDFNGYATLPYEGGGCEAR